MLKREGIQFQVCRNPDVKCSVVERAQRTIREKLYRYFTYRNTQRYIDVLPRFVRAYNDPCTVQLAWRHQKSQIQTYWRYGRGQQTRIVVVKYVKR